MSAIKAKPRERTAVLASLRAGVVPKIGLHLIQVGRKAEVAAVLKDLEHVESGGAAIRFVIGRYGSGKTFFLNLARAVAHEKGFVVVSADVTTERRLQSTSGHARALYSELMRNVSNKTKPEGGALQSVIERWLSRIDGEERQRGGTVEVVLKRVRAELAPLLEHAGGYDFTSVLVQYYEAFAAGDDAKRDSALRWLRAEYTTKTDARNDLGVRTFLDDSGFYDHLKLFAAFTKLAGNAGLLVLLDELGVLSHRLSNATARNSNYEAILRILNDCLQGSARHIDFVFGGTDEFLEDRRRGLYSYEALATRLAPNRLASADMKDLSGPVIRLGNLTQEDLFVLLRNVRNVFGSAPNMPSLPDEALTAFMERCAKTLGAQYFRTPRDTVAQFAGFLSLLEQHPGTPWRQVLELPEAQATPPPSASAEAAPAVPDDGPALATDDELTTFKL